MTIYLMVEESERCVFLAGVRNELAADYAR